METRRKFLGDLGKFVLGAGAVAAVGADKVEADDCVPVTEFPKTREEFLDAVFIPCPEGVEGCRNLELSEIQPLANDQGEVIGFQVLRQLDPKRPIEPFYIKNPFGEQFGFMHRLEDRSLLGLKLEETRFLGYEDEHVGSGIPGGFVGPVEALTFYKDQSADLAKLVGKQTVMERASR